MNKTSNDQFNAGYRHICEDLRGQIGGGRLAGGAPLPSEAALARRYKVSRMTVRHALRLLETDGLLKVIPGKGRQVVWPRTPAAAARQVAGRILCAAGGTGANCTHPYIAGIHEGISQVLRAAQIEVDVRFERDPSVSAEELLAGDHVGIVVVGIYREDVLRAAGAGQRPAVLLNYRPLDGRDAVSTDNYAGGHQVGEKMLALGHRRFGHVNRKIADMAFRDRYEGFMRALEDAGVARQDVLTIWGPEWAAHDPDGTLRLTETLRSHIASRSLPTAFFCSTDEQACRLMDLLQTLGADVPRDVSIVGFDRYVASPRPGRRELATFEQPGVEVGRRGAEKLLRRLADPETPASVEMIAAKWIEGETLAAAPPAGQ